MKLHRLSPLALVVAGCAGAPAKSEPAPAAKAPAVVASGRPEIRYYEISDA
jgi:hypothetical protein